MQYHISSSTPWSQSGCGSNSPRSDIFWVHAEASACRSDGAPSADCARRATSGDHRRPPRPIIVGRGKMRMISTCRHIRVYIKTKDISKMTAFHCEPRTGGPTQLSLYCPSTMHCREHPVEDARPRMYVCIYVWSSHIAEYGSTG